MAEKSKLVRLLDTDVPGDLALHRALKKVHGISFAMANAVCAAADVDKFKKVNELTAEELKKIETIARNPAGKIPSWLLNRRADPETGEDKHIITSQLKLRKEFDIKNLMKIKCYRGMRHSWGLPVRGQRTRAHFRKGKVIGVTKKAKRGKK